MSIIQLSELSENYNQFTKDRLTATIIQLSELSENYNILTVFSKLEEIIQLSELSENYNFNQDLVKFVLLYNYLNCQRTITQTFR